MWPWWWGGGGGGGGGPEVGRVCVCFPVGGRAPALHTRPKSENVQKEAIGSTVRVTETAKPCGRRALGSRAGPVRGAERRVPASPPPSGMSVTEILVSVTSTNLIFARHLDLGYCAAKNVFPVRVRGAGFVLAAAARF